MSKTQKFIAVIALQVLIIFAVIFSKTFMFAGGKAIFLQVKPIDPTSLLRGDYIHLTYKISTVEEDTYYAKKINLKRGDTVYVVLHQFGKYFDTIPYSAVRKDMTDIPNGNQMIKGRVVDVYGDAERGMMKVSIKYGIEDYFIPEKAGEKFNPQGQDIYVKVVLDADGNAVLRGLYVNGKPWPSPK